MHLRVAMVAASTRAPADIAGAIKLVTPRVQAVLVARCGGIKADLAASPSPSYDTAALHRLGSAAGASGTVGYGGHVERTASDAARRFGRTEAAFKS